MYIRQLNNYIYESIKYLKNVHFFNSDSILFSINKKTSIQTDLAEEYT